MEPLTILIVLIALIVLWAIIRAILKFTLKVFGCGLLVLLILGLIAYALSQL